MNTIRSSLLFLKVLLISFGLAQASNPMNDWIAGTGFPINGVPDRVKMEQTREGLQITQGGFYLGSELWGGVASASKFDLNNFQMVIQWDRLPQVGPEDDAWISISFVEFPELFQLRNIAGNRGYANLIRLSRGRLVSYELLDEFRAVHTIVHDDFSFRPGDRLTVEVRRAGSAFEFIFNDKKVNYLFENLNDVFESGRAHVVISASMRGSSTGAFTYTLISVNNQSLASGR